MFTVEEEKEIQKMKKEDLKNAFGKDNLQDMMETPEQSFNFLLNKINKQTQQLFSQHEQKYKDIIQQKLDKFLDAEFLFMGNPVQQIVLKKIYKLTDEKCSQYHHMHKMTEEEMNTYVKCTMDVQKPYGVQKIQNRILPDISQSIECFSKAWYNNKNEKAIEEMDKCLEEFEDERTKT